MKQNYPYEKEAFSLLIRLERGSIQEDEVVAWADKRIEENRYDDTLANISLHTQDSNPDLHTLLRELIGNYKNLEIEHAKEEAVETAKGIISEEIHLVLGCRKLDQITTLLDLDDIPEYRIFCGVDSEADGYPITEEHRARWNSTALKDKDEQYNLAVAAYFPEVKEACRSLIERIEPADRGNG